MWKRYPVRDRAGTAERRICKQNTKGVLDMKGTFKKLCSFIILVCFMVSLLPSIPETALHSMAAGGTDLYVGYSDKSPNYATVQEAVNAAASINPKSEDQRVYIHIAPGTYREQVIINTPYISFVNDTPTKDVTITWYYGIGYKYYSVGSNGFYSADAAASKSAKTEPGRWGCSVRVLGDYFRAEYITFENSFNRYVTDEEIADGVEVSGSQSITFQRVKGADVQSKAATERAAALAVEADYCEFFSCEILSNQDTLYTRGIGYYKNCKIEGNTDYIYGQGDNVFEECDLSFKGYSANATGGVITAKTNTGKYLFYNCNVVANSELTVPAGRFGRPWSANADVAFVNTKLQYEGIIASDGWTKMSGNSPENANFKEYNTTANGKAVNTSGRVANTVLSSGDGLTPTDYLGAWTPYYFGAVPGAKYEPLEGRLIKQLTISDTAHYDSWKIEDAVNVGGTVYGDRDYTYTSLPRTIAGGESILTACDSKTYTGNLAVFTAGEDMDVFVLLDERVTTAPSWLGEWKATGETAVTSNDVTYKVYQKSVKTGESVTLGTNGQTSGCVGYTVFAVSHDDIVCIAGDVNFDERIDGFDLSLAKKYYKNGFESTAAQLAADVDQSGTVDAADIKLMQDFLLARIKAFPVQTDDDNSDNNAADESYQLSVNTESMEQIDVGTEKALDTIEFVLDTSNDYALHVNVGFWSAWANVQCSGGKLTEIEDSQNVDSITIDGNKVTIQLSAGVYASANASNSSQAPYLGKVSLHHNSGGAAINVISYEIKYVEVVTPEGINIDDLLDMSELEGWATVEGDGLKTTTGGAGGEVVVVTNLAEFAAVSSDDTPRIIVVDGVIQCDDDAIRIGSNKTVVGANANAEIKGGLDINTESNIIVANLTIDAQYPNGSVADCFAARNVHHMWVTHVTAHDASDGLLDLTIGSNYITVSWCKFYYDDTSNDHRLACLDSNGTTAGDTDTGRNKVSYHHNWWAHGCDQRMPRILFGQGHVYNNYYSAEGNSYCIGVGSYASVLVEGNYFKNVKDPHEFMYTHALPAYITARDNVYDNTTGNQQSGLGGGEFGNVDPFTDPPYDYTLDNAKDIPTIVQNGAGPQ